MAPKNEVDLVVKAKNEASKTLKAIAQAFEEFKTTLDTANEATAKGNTAIGGLSTTLVELNKRAAGLKALEEVAKNIDAATQASKRLEDVVAKGGDELGKMAVDAALAAERTKQFKTQLENERATLVALNADRKLANKVLSETTKAVKEAERAQIALNKTQSQPTKKRTAGVGRDIGAPQTSARDSASAFIAADLEKVNRALADAKQYIDLYDAEIKQSKANLLGLEPAVKAAAEQQRKLEAETAKQTGTLRQNQIALAASREELAQLGAVNREVEALAGKQTVAQAKVANAYEKTAIEIERVTKLSAALNRYSTGLGSFADPKTAAALQRQNTLINEAETNWKALEAEARRLSGELKNVSGNATAQVDAFNRIIAASRAARAEYNAQVSGLAKMQGSVKTTFAAWSQAAGGFQTFKSAAATIAPAVNSASAAMKSAATSGTALSQSLKSIANDTRQSLSLFQRLRGEVLALTASYIGLQGGARQLYGVVEATNVLEAATSRLNVAFKGNTGRVALELGFIEKEAARLGISFQVLSEQYSKFAIAAQGANFTNESTRDIFLSVAEAGKVQRLSIEQMTGVFKAFEQIISKGKVQSEELRGQLGDRLTGSFQLFADAIGVTTAELDSMLKKGEVFANQDTLGKVGDRLREVYGPALSGALKSTNTEIGKFQNNLFQAQLTIGEGGFVEAFANGIRDLNEGLTSREGRDFFLALGAALGKVTDGLVAVMPYFDEMATVIGVITAIKVGGWFQGLIQGLRESATGTLASNKALFTWAATTEVARARWNGLVSTLRVGTGVMTATRASISALGVQAQTTGVRMTALRVGITALQTVAGVATGVFRVLWSAIGGIPGIILTGVSIALGSWLTTVKETTSSIDEHKRIMGEVVAAYQAAKGASADWAKNIRNATVDQVVASLRNMRNELTQSKKQLQDIEGFDFFTINGLNRAGVDIAPVRQIQELRKQFEAGQIDIKDFNAALSAIYKTVQNDGIRKFIESLLETGRAVEEQTKSVSEAEIVAKELGDTTVKTTGTMDDLAKSFGTASEAADTSVKSSEKFNTALSAMSELIPKISSDLEKLGQIDTLNRLYQDAAQAATNFGDLNKATQTYNAALGGITSGALGSNSSFVDRLVSIESGGSATAKNPNSSATGLGQFIQSTWIRMFKQYFPEAVAGFKSAGLESGALDQRILQYREDPTISKQMIALYAQENARYLAAQGITASNATLYLAHFLGAGDAAKVINLSASTPVADVVNSSSVAANPTILGGGRTTGDVVAWAERLMGISTEELAVQQQISDLDTKAAAATQKRITDAEFELQQQQLIANGEAKRAAIEKAAAEARTENKNITEEQLTKVRELAALEFDLKNTKTAQKEEQAQANELLRQAQALYQQQIALEAQLKQQQGLGDVTGADLTKTKLAEVNEQLVQAIANGRAMWESIGGEAATTAITKLDTLNTKIATANQKTNQFGLTSQQVSGFVDTFASGIANAFGSFAQAVANGEDAFKAFGTAVLQTLAQILQQIAITILKTMILKALTGFGGGIGSAASGLLSAGVNHSGGVAGSGSRSRNISAAALSSPFVYHNGGVAGLNSNEVVSVLQRGETIRTKEQEAALTEKQDAAAMATKTQESSNQTIRNIITLDEDSARNWLTSSTGEKAIWDVLGKNKGKLRGLAT